MTKLIPADNIPADDRITPIRTIYNASAYEIFWRNFLAGISRTMGGILIYLIVFLLLTGAFATWVYPKIAPFLDAYLKIGNSINNFQQFQIPQKLPSLQL